MWPEGDAFGAADIAPEDEFLALREIHFAELPGGSTSPAAAGGGGEMGGGGMGWDGTDWIWDGVGVDCGKAEWHEVSCCEVEHGRGKRNVCNCIWDRNLDATTLKYLSLKEVCISTSVCFITFILVLVYAVL